MPNYMQILETAVQHGMPVLLKNVHETLDASLDPILNKAIMKIGAWSTVWPVEAKQYKVRQISTSLILECNG